jgi:hypothetical protein
MRKQRYTLIAYLFQSKSGIVYAPFKKRSGSIRAWSFFIQKVKLPGCHLILPVLILICWWDANNKIKRRKTMSKKLDPKTKEANARARRNSKIQSLREAGLSFKAIGEKVGLSGVRVCKILRTMSA